MAVKAILFDLDGTLLDTALDLGQALNAMLEHDGQPSISLEKIRPKVSNGANALLQLGYGLSPSCDGHAEHRQRLLDFYLQNVSVHTQAFPGVDDLIEKISARGLQWGIITNKPWTYTEALLPHHQFASEPAIVLCPEHVEEKKPHPESLHKASKVLQLDLEDLIYVGDHRRDIECGQRAEVPTIAVGYGYTHSPDEHLGWGADYTVEHASEIWPIVEQLL